MNFRELFSKLDEISQFPMPTNPAHPLNPLNPSSPTYVAKPKNNQQTAPTQTAPTGTEPKPVPGQQPSLGPKPQSQLSPQQLQALQFPNQKPAAAPATVTDPKADVNAMASALKAIAKTQPTQQPTMQPTTSAGVQQQQQSANEPKQIATPKPGEPVEEDQLDEATREEKIEKWKNWLAKNPDKADQVPASIKDAVVPSSSAPAANNVDVQTSKTQALGLQFAKEKDPAKKELLRKDYEAAADELKKMQGDKKAPSEVKPKAVSNYKGSTGSQEIKKLNPNIKDVNKIYVGQEITMPDGSKYTVKKGDTLDAIARGAKPAAKPEVATGPNPEVATGPKPEDGFNKGAGEKGSPNPALAGDEVSGTRWVSPAARSNAPDTALDKLPAGQRDALDTTYSTNSDNTGVVPTVDKSTYSKNAWIEKHDKRSGWEKTMPKWLGGKDANIPDQPNYKVTPGEQPYRNPVPQAKQAEADKFANMSAKELQDYRAAQLSGGKDIDPAAINPKVATVKEDVVISEMNQQLDTLADELINEDSTTLGSKWATKSAKLAPWAGNVAKGANIAISAKDIADYAKKGDTLGAGIASAALAADAAGTVFPPASWASFALDMANAGRDVYLKQTGQAYPDPDQQVPTKEGSDDLDKIKHLTRYKADSK